LCNDINRIVYSHFNNRFALRLLDSEEEWVKYLVKKGDEMEED